MIWMSPFRRVGSTIQVNYRRTDIAYCQNVTKLYLFSQHRDTELDSILFTLCVHRRVILLQCNYFAGLLWNIQNSRRVIFTTSLRLEIYMHIIISNANANSTRIRERFIYNS